MKTDDLIQTIREKIDYTLSMDERVDLINCIDQEFGDALNDLLTTFEIEGQNNFTNKEVVRKYNALMEAMSDYVLLYSKHEETEGQKQNKKDYPFYKTTELKDGKSNQFLDINDFANQLRNENSLADGKHISIDGGAKNITVDYVKNKMNECPPIGDYVNYERRISQIIETLDKQYKSKIDKGLKVEDIKDLKWTNPNTGIKYYYTGQDLLTLKKSVGYKPNNCIELNKDVIAVYDSWYQPFCAKSSGQAMELSRRLDIDFFDEEHVRGLLNTCCLTGWSTKFDKLVDKLDRLVDVAGLTDRETQIYRLLRAGKGGNYEFSELESQLLTHNKIAQILKTSRQSITKSIQNIVKKIIDAYELEFQDYYYTELVKGTYRQCVKCNKNKLLTKENFLYRPNRNTYDRTCKECSK